MFKQALLLLSVAAAGCSVAGAGVSDGSSVVLGSTKEAMVGGTVSTSSQDSVVFVMKGQTESCSGTLIAPNLVLTARHCVADPDESDTTECVGYGDTIDPSQMTIKLGADAGWDTGGPVAGTGVKIYTPKTVNMCGYDIALIQLSADVAGAKLSPMRFTDILPNEPTVAVGYGVDENNNNLPSRMQRTTTVLGVGPAKVAYTENDGTVFNYDTPEGDVVTGESTCFGDSGGPLFDMKGNIVAMTSRGPLNAPTDGDHGNTCADMISVYAGAKFNEAIIREAATAAGHPLPAATTQSTGTGTTGTGKVGTSSKASTGDDDDDDDDTGSTTKKKSASPTTDAIPSAGGCSATGGHASTDSWALVLGVAAVIAASRRKNRAA